MNQSRARVGRRKFGRAVNRDGWAVLWAQKQSAMLHMCERAHLPPLLSTPARPQCTDQTRDATIQPVYHCIQFRARPAR